MLQIFNPKLWELKNENFFNKRKNFYCFHSIFYEKQKIIKKQNPTSKKMTQKTIQYKIIFFKNYVIKIIFFQIILIINLPLKESILVLGVFLHEKYFLGHFFFSLFLFLFFFFIFMFFFYKKLEKKWYL